LALLVLVMVWSAPAKACFVFVRYSVAVSAIITECIVGPDSISDHDQMIPADDDLASSSSADFILRMLSGYRSNLSAVNNVGDKNTTPIVLNVGSDVLRTAVSH